MDRDLILVSDVAGAGPYVAHHQVQLDDLDLVALPAQEAVFSGAQLQAILGQDSVPAERQLGVAHGRGSHFTSENVEARLARIGSRLAGNDVALFNLADVLDVLVVNLAFIVRGGHERRWQQQQLDFGVAAGPRWRATGDHHLFVKGLVLHDAQHGRLVDAVADVALLELIQQQLGQRFGRSHARDHGHGDAQREAAVHDPRVVTQPRCWRAHRGECYNQPVPMNAILQSIAERQLKPDVPQVAPGDTVKVHVKVVEGTRERIQVFEGTVMRLRSGGSATNFTVRRIAHSIGVERTFLLHSPRIDKIEVLRHGKVRRAQLYYLRGRVGKSAKIKERRT